LLDRASVALAEFERTAPTAFPVTAAARRWQVSYPGIDPMEVIFAPEATHAEVAALYPGARVEPMPEIGRGTA